jgi:hypothetical protein
VTLLGSIVGPYIASVSPKTSYSLGLVVVAREAI